MKHSDIQALESIPAITSTKRISFSKVIAETMHKKEHARVARGNARALCAYAITYRSGRHQVNGFIVEPKKSKGRMRLPVIIWNRGGYGERYAIKEKWLFYGTIPAFARAGYIVIATQYSGNAGSEGVDEFGGSELADVLTLQNIIKKYVRADEKRIGMYGESRGGMMTYLALARSRFICAAVTVAGIADLTKKSPSRITLSKKEREERSAILFAKRFPKNTPLLIMHGTGDTSVPVTDSLALAQKLALYNKPFELHLYKDDDHFLSHHKEEKIARARRWFEIHLA